MAFSHKRGLGTIQGGSCKILLQTFVLMGQSNDIGWSCATFWQRGTLKREIRFHYGGGGLTPYLYN